MSIAVRRALYGKLSSDTTLNNLLATAPTGWTRSIYDSIAPANASFPYVIINLSSDVPEEAMQDAEAYVEHRWLVKAVDRNNSFDPADTIAERIAVLLNDVTLSISGGSLMYLRRQSGVRYPEVESGEQYRHSGGLYRLVWQ